MAQKIPSWLESPETWDTCVLNNRVVPGVVRVRFTAKSGLSVRKPPKGHYAAIVDQGHPPMTGELIVKFGFEGTAQGYGSAEKQIQLWFELMDEIYPQRRNTRSAYPITHPALASVGVSRVFITDASSPEGEGPKPRTATLKWLEYGNVTSAAAGEVSAGPAQPIGSVDITTLDTVPSPAATESGP